MKSKLIVALDVPSYEEATHLVDAVGDGVNLYKVGSQLFTREGPRMLEFLASRHKQCFLDLKFHDIPNTVAKAVESAAALPGVLMLTLHTAHGPHPFRVAGVFRDYGSERGMLLMGLPAYRAHFRDSGVTGLGLTLAPGAEASAVTGRLRALAGPRQVLQVRDQAWGVRSTGW